MKRSRVLRIASAGILALAVTVLTLPLVLAVGTSMTMHTGLFDETGAGAYLWLYIPGIPSAAVLLAVAFLVDKFARRSTHVNENETQN